MIQQQTCLTDPQFQALLEGALPDQQLASAAAHLESCQACRERLESLAGGSGLVPEEVVGDPGPGARSSALEEAIRKLIDDRDVGETLVESNPGPPSLTFLSPSAHPRHLGRLGSYEILEVIGRGGMGTVLKARDAKLERLVAVKVLNADLASHGAARKRFLGEARSAAAVTHEHVVTIHAVEDTAEVPYLVMEYVLGVSLEDRIERSGHLRVEEILRIGMQTASGLAAAHAQGLVHRDIKPSNILLENGVERVKITDFGLARVVHEAQLTRSDAIAGTPPYMSPEQARGEPVDGRSDLFSLGCVLYAMCVGRSPFRAETPRGAMHRVIEDTPRPIREINPEIPEWLVAIIDRLLQKDPADRFQTADEVAGLLGQYLAHVQHPSRVELPHDSRFSSRSWSAPRAWRLAAALGCLCVMLLGVSGYTWFTNGRERDLPAAVGDGSSAPRTSDDAITKAALRLRVQEAVRAGVRLRVTISGRGQHISRVAPADETFDLDPGVYTVEIAGSSRGSVLRRGQIELAPGTTRRISCGFSDLASRPSPPERRYAAELSGHGGGVVQIAFMHKKETLAAACQDGGVYLWSHTGGQWKRGQTFRDNNVPLRCLTFSADDQILATGGDDSRILLWGVRSGSMSELTGHIEPVESLVITPDQRMLASIDSSGIVILWDLGGHTEKHRVTAVRGRAWGATTCYRIAISADGQILATSGPEETVKLWNARTLQPLRTLHGASRRIDDLAFFPDGATVIAADTAGTKLWDVETGQLRAAVASHGAFASSVAVAPDGNTVACGNSQCVQLWDVESQSITASFPTHWDRSASMAFCPWAPTLLATAGHDCVVRLWDTSESQPPPPGQRPRLLSTILTWDRPFAVSRDWLAVVEDRASEYLRIRSMDNLELTAEIELPKPKSCWPKSVACLRHSRGFVTALGDRTLVLWEFDAQQREFNQSQPHQLDSRESQVAVSPDGRWVAATQSKRVSLFNGENLADQGELDIPEGVPVGLAFCPQRTVLAVGTHNGWLLLWDVEARSRLSSLRPGTSRILGLAFSPDGKTLVSTSEDSRVKLWDVQNPKSAIEIGEFSGHTGVVFAVDFTPDGKHLVTCGGFFDFNDPNTIYDRPQPGEVKVWDVATTRLLTDVDAGLCAFDARFSEDGKRLFIAADSKLYVWDVEDVLQTSAPSRD